MIISSLTIDVCHIESIQPFTLTETQTTVVQHKADIGYYDV